jgi:hypothetical protein
LGRLTSVCERILTGTGGQANGDIPIQSGCNPDYPNYKAFQTTYGYDVLNNITLVTQDANNPGYTSQTRTFAYDGLSRLTSEANPEMITKTYSYDHTGQLGDLYQRTAGEPNHTDGSTSTATHTYDALHRLRQISYSDPYTPTSYFKWDTQSCWSGAPTNYPKGRLACQYIGTSPCPSCAGEAYLYDMDGNVIGKASWTPSNIGSRC